LKADRLGAALLLVLSISSTSSGAQDPDDEASPVAPPSVSGEAGQESAAEPAGEGEPPLIDTSQDAGEDDDMASRRRRRRLFKTDFDGPLSTFSFGLGFLLDGAAYSQSDGSEAQVTIDDPDYGVRDSRLLARGKFHTERPFSWTIGYMYDNSDSSWRFRQTGLQIGFPEAKGRLFIGRTKEGFSLIKVMTGYHPWTQERSPGLDAFVPILADGFKWMGYFPEKRMFFSLGVFGDQWSEDEGFATYDNQVVTRVGGLPISRNEGATILHVAVMARSGDPDEGSIGFRSKPEDSLSPFFVDTGKFAADQATTLGAEAYYRSGPLMFGGEYNRQTADAVTGHDPAFHAADAVVVWMVTGETRGYNAPGGFFEAISPDRTVFEGGIGALEAVFHVSYIDLDDGTFNGGKMWRITPMMNWHLSDNIRFELGYGYAELDRFDRQGSTQFLQSRLQLTL
jgi:phosphate-selective porin OprO/OprP